MTRREIPADAPAFNPGRSDYPLGGAKVGPIWRAAWTYLRMGPGYVVGSEIVEGVRLVIPDAHPETIRQILRRAVVAGILESEQRSGGKPARTRAHFRIKR